ncbi:MAG: N-acetylneuraminate synthase family protein [Myxococcales bacterium]|nr:N-acetylneuraminate synthase family protein [Myxococcales bacterium]
MGDSAVGGGAPAYVIAEAGVNHNGDVDTAIALIDAAARAGADAVKFQTFVPELLASPLAGTAEYQRERASGDSQLEMLRRLALPDDAWPRLQEHARARGIEFLSTPFDHPSLELLLRIGVTALKISSGDLTNDPLIVAAAASRVPILMSSGMANMEEVAAAVALVDGRAPFALFHCVSNYPTAASQCNLRAIESLRARFGCPCGWSDHTDGVDITVAAVARGAELIEKHLTLDRHQPGPDHAASLAPETFAELVASVRRTEAALGDGVKVPTEPEHAIAAIGRKSVCARRALEAGSLIGPDDVYVARPGTGLPPREIAAVVGRRLTRALRAGEPLAADSVE